MRRIGASNLWIGHVGDGGNPVLLGKHGIAALVELAVNEMPVHHTGREMVHCRFPITDGGGNQTWVLRGAVEAVEGLIRANVRTLVFCGAGMSRAPSVAAGGLALASGRPTEDCLLEVVRDGPADVSPALWGEVTALVGALRLARLALA